MKNSKRRKILGVDPGTNLLGYAIIEIHGDQVHMIDMGEFQLRKLPNAQEKLKEIFLQLQEVIEYHLPDSMAIEAPFYGKNPQSMLKLGRAQGVAMAAAITMGLDITEYAPRKIKQAVTGNGNATKEQVAAMLTNILKVNLSEKTLDASDALAVAFCHHLQFGAPISTSKTNSWKRFIAENPDRL